MPDLQIDAAKSLSKSLKVFFYNSINVEICVNSLFDNFRSHCVVFFLFFSLDGGSGFGLQAIYNISYLFFSKHGLSEISLLGPVCKACKLFSFFTIIILDGHSKQKKRRVKIDAFIQCIHQVS